MKVSGILASGAFLLQTASAHYIFQTVNGGAAYQYFRTNTNYNSPVVDTTSNDMRCNVGAGTGGSTQTLTISAGSKITLGLDTAVYHNGPILFYLGRASGSAQSWDGSGANWFKFEQRGPNFSGGSVTWPMSISYDVTIPSGVPSGQWLLRAEQIGIHNPYPAGDPQFYIGCAQLQITNGGSCSPSYFSIPGHIKATDPGITVNIYSNFNSYTFPGPAVQACNTGGGGGGNPTTTAARTTTTLATTTRTTTPGATTARTTTTSAAGGGGSGAPLYGQCGGQGWTGPTTCAQGTCKVLNAYYSQCT
ncbi:hypothetical protein TWF281_000399 [Arthrobotrys megalospora]